MNPIEEAARAAGRGELIILPTDTVYGIGTRPDDPEATARVFEAKRRPAHLELPVLVTGLAQAETVAVLDEAARRLVERFWPGPLTVVLPRGPGTATWSLGGDPATVGLRAPAHPLALEVLRRTGPLAVTSANISGEPTPATCDELHAVFGEAVSVYLCDERPLAGRASTVVRLTGDGVEILRKGDLTELEIRAALDPGR